MTDFWRWYVVNMPKVYDWRTKSIKHRPAGAGLLGFEGPAGLVWLALVLVVFLRHPGVRRYASDWSRTSPGVAENRAGARADHVDICDTSIPHTSELPGKIKNSWGHIIYLPVRILDYLTNLRLIIYINYNIYNIYINTISSTDLKSRECLQDTCLPASKCWWG